MSSPGTAPRRVVLGRITGVFGIKGWVKVDSFTDPVESILGFREWQLERRAARREAQVREGRRHGKRVVVHIVGFDDRDAAAELVGAEISVARDSLPPLAAREFYRADLIGFTVRDASGKVLGSVDHFVDAPAHPFLVVRGEIELWLPAAPPHLRRVDLAKGEVHVDWPPMGPPADEAQEPDDGSGGEPDGGRQR